MLSLIFAPGERPSAPEIEQMLDVQTEAARGLRVSHRPDDEEGWLELLSSGLTFDLAGLRPAQPRPVPAATQYLGLAGQSARPDVEALSLGPSPHISAGGAMIPVARVMLALATQLTQMFPCFAVCWHPSGCWMEPKYFVRTVESWLFGGPFPALGLTFLHRDALGDITSHGLAFFLGQEIVLEARMGEASADTVKLAVRAIDELIRSGPVATQRELDVADGEGVFAEPSANGNVLRLWRSR